MTDPEDKAWAANWMHHAAGDWGSKGRAEEKTEEQQLRSQLQRMQRCRPIAFRWLVLNSTRAAAIAAKAGLDDRHYRPEDRSDEERAHASVTVAEALAAMAEQRPPIASYPADRPDAPQIVANAAQQVAEAFEAKHGRRPGQLSAEQLAAVRKAASITLPDPKPNVVPLRPAASPMHTEVRRGPIIDEDSDAR